MTAIDQKKIASNTLLLYVRMIVVMLVGLYTSRVVFEALGKLHMGIYDAVGGIVLMISFISSTMARQVISLGGDGSMLVPDHVLKTMRSKLNLK